jgi:hypothetical protein
LKNNHKVIKEWQEKIEVAKEIVNGIQDELRTQITKYDELINKHMLLEN